MQYWIRERAAHPIVLAAVGQLRRQYQLGPRAPRLAIAQAVHGWIRETLTFRQDEPLLEEFGYPEGAEVLIEPARLLTMPIPRGDCDDYTMLVCALLAAQGVPSEIVTIAADPEQPQRWSHVFAEAVLENGDRITLDASHGPYPGWRPPHYYAEKKWGVVAPAPRLTTGLNGYQVSRGGLGFTEQPWYTRLIEPGFELAKLAIVRPGTSYVDPSGAVLQRQAPGTFTFPPPALPGTGSTTSWLILAAIGIGAFALLGRRG